MKLLRIKSSVLNYQSTDTKTCDIKFPLPAINIPAFFSINGANKEDVKVRNKNNYFLIIITVIYMRIKNKIKLYIDKN